MTCVMEEQNDELVPMCGGGGCQVAWNHKHDCAAELVSYVRNNAFPQPLSEQDESKYLGMMAEGDAKARNLLIPA